MKKIFKLNGLDCAHCSTKIENSIKKIDGMEIVTVNFMTTKMIVEFNEKKIEDISSTVRKIINKLEPDIEVKEI